MILFYAVILLLLFTFIMLLKKYRSAFSKALFMFLLIFIIIAGTFVLDNSKDSNTVKAVEKLKFWLNGPMVKTNSFLEDNFDVAIIKIKDRVLIDVPAVNQFPELPRGCEVTSLAMLLQHANINADKLALAEEIQKNPEPHRIENGKIYFGHPNDGFVGDMYSFDKPGLGVYHKPIKELADKYLPGAIKDLTGADFTELKTHLSDNRPVWVIINTKYKKLSNDFFQTWHTPRGEIQITYKEHSVLITGYDHDFVYFNDPLTGEKNKKAPKADFEKSWVQMGRQAIAYLPH